MQKGSILSPFLFIFMIDVAAELTRDGLLSDCMLMIKLFSVRQLSDTGISSKKNGGF